MEFSFYFLFQKRKEVGSSFEYSESETTCPIETCRLKFVNATGLFNHQLSSDHFTQYCVICRKSYVRIHELRRHITSVHSRVQEECWICKKSFSRWDSLMAHQLKVHQCVSCKHCGASFPEQNMLKQHRAQAHSTSKTYP